MTWKKLPLPKDQEPRFIIVGTSLDPGVAPTIIRYIKEEDLFLDYYALGGAKLRTEDELIHSWNCTSNGEFLIWDYIDFPNNSTSDTKGAVDVTNLTEQSLEKLVEAIEDCL